MTEPLQCRGGEKNLDFMHSNPQYMACPGIYDIESVEATDEYTVTITYPHPYYGYAMTSAGRCRRNAVAQSNCGGRFPDGSGLCWHRPLHL